MRINDRVPDLEFEVYHNDQTKKMRFADFAGKWLVVFFYPADFTFVCPTELQELATLYPEFQKIGTEVLSVSTDTVFVHKAWHDNSEAIKTITFPMAADPARALCSAFGTLIEAEGLSQRASFVIDPDGLVKAYEMHDNSIGRSAEELLRKVHAAQFVREHGGEVCPANWKPGGKTLRPGLDLVGKI